MEIWKPARTNPSEPSWPPAPSSLQPLRSTCNADDPRSLSRRAEDPRLNHPLAPLGSAYATALRIASGHRHAFGDEQHSVLFEDAPFLAGAGAPYQRNAGANSATPLLVTLKRSHLSSSKRGIQGCCHRTTGAARPRRDRSTTNGTAGIATTAPSGCAGRRSPIRAGCSNPPAPADSWDGHGSYRPRGPDGDSSGRRVSAPIT
jgi:hypothetical protein